MLHNHTNNLQSQVIKSLEKELEFTSTSSNLNDSLWNLLVPHKDSCHANRIRHLIECCRNQSSRQQISDIIRSINDDDILNDFLSFLNPSSRTETDRRLFAIESEMRQMRSHLSRIENINLEQNNSISQIDENTKSYGK